MEGGKAEGVRGTTGKRGKGWRKLREVRRGKGRGRRKESRG